MVKKKAKKFNQNYVLGVVAVIAIVALLISVLGMFKGDGALAGEAYKFNLKNAKQVATAVQCNEQIRNCGLATQNDIKNVGLSCNNFKLNKDSAGIGANPNIFCENKGYNVAVMRIEEKLITSHVSADCKGTLDMKLSTSVKPINAGKIKDSFQDDVNCKTVSGKHTSVSNSVDLTCCKAS